jgi:hypothetical protein
MSTALDALTAEYQAKAKRDGFLHLGDAQEALAVTRDYALRNWLSDFILRWESAEMLANYPPTSEAAIFSQALIDILRHRDTECMHSIARDALQRVRKLQTGASAC